MSFDLHTVSVVVGIAVGIVGVLGTVFGWFSNAWNWTRSKFHAGSSAPVVPKKTLILLQSSAPNDVWWHMGKQAEEPAMQIHGQLKATNIHTSPIFAMGAKLRRPKAFGHTLVRHQIYDIYSSENAIAPNGIGDVTFDFWVHPPIYEEGTSFKTDVAIIDQFGNEHWLKRVQFHYS